MTSLIRTTADERRLLFSAFAIGCPTALPENIHITLDLLRRDTGLAPREIVQLLKGLSSLGFEVELRQGHDDDEEEEELVVIEWHDRTVYDDIEDPDDGSVLDSSCGAGVLNGIFSILVKDHCDECIQNAIEHLDFGFLASRLTEH